MTAVSICSDLGAPKIKSLTVSIVSPSICHEVTGPDAMILVFWMLSFKPTFSLLTGVFLSKRNTLESYHCYVWPVCLCFWVIVTITSYINLPNSNQRRRQWHPTPVRLPGKSHGRRSLEGCSPWGCWGSDTTERLHFHFSLSCIGEGNGNPLQCSCLENPRDGGAFWDAVSGVTQSDTTEVT